MATTRCGSLHPNSQEVRFWETTLEGPRRRRPTLADLLVPYPRQGWLTLPRSPFWTACQVRDTLRAYSKRRATIGSVREARRAGIRQANVATINSRAATPEMVRGSRSEEHTSELQS